MSFSNTKLLEFITRLTYNIEGLSGELKLYFSQFLTFHFSKTLSNNQIQDVENWKASKTFESKEEILEAASVLSIENKIWSIAAIQLLQMQAEKVDDRIVSRRVGLLIKDLVSIFDLENEENRIAEERKNVENEINQFENRPTIKIPAKIWPLALDYGIRWALLLRISYFGLDKDPLAENVFFIPVFILILVYFVGKRHEKANQKMLDAYGGAQLYKVEYHVSTTQYTWLAVFLGTSVFISYLLQDQLHVLALLGLTLYYFIYLRFLRVGRIEENDLVRQLENKTLNTESLNVDENDEVIVALETKLNSSTSRLEAYVLESALFGALSFSGFLEIMAADLVSFSDLENFASNILNTSQGLIHFEWDKFNVGLAGLTNKISLFCLVSVESLICSIFFLAVIASRLRFSDIADKVHTAINLAKAYNIKEEALHDEHQITGKKNIRLEALTTKVNEQLHEAALVLEEVNPVMMYMQYFRNAGILVFLVILISSSLFITGVLSWTFLALVLATYLYFNRTAINNRFKAFFLSFRIQFIKQGYWLFGIALLPQVLAYVLRIFFHVRGTDSLMALSYFLMGLYFFFWLILAAHVDEQFGEIESTQKNLSRQIRWRFVRNTVAVLILIYGIALAFKELKFIGADEILFISLTGLTISMYFVGYYLTKVPWLGVICGGIISVACFGILFKTLHFTGADQMLWMALAAFFILPPIIIWKRNVFHKLFLRFCLAGFLISAWYSPVLHRVPSLQAAYVHETTSTGEILKVLEVNRLELFFEKGNEALDSGIAKSDWYINHYGTRQGFTFIYMELVEEYWSFARSAITPDEATHKIDTTLLPLALKAARQENKILKLFDYPDLPWFITDTGLSLKPIEMEANVLLAMGKREEAIQSLENIIGANSPDDLKETLMARIALIKSQSQ